VAVDVDKVKIEMPVESPGVAEPAAPGAPAASGAAGTASDPFKPAEPAASADEEQKKIDDLFKK